MRIARTAPRGPEKRVPGVHGRPPSLLRGRSVTLLPAGWTPTHRSGIVVDVPFNIVVYYSFMTLDAVGNGDALPLAAACRAAATLEAVLGQFYLAVLIAQLVGLHIADTRTPR